MSGHDPLALAEWQRVRRYAVPARMIAECTAAREAGDWQAACQAGRIDVGDLGAAAVHAGHLAPDLLRWHLPRALGGDTTLAVDRRYVLIPGEGTLGPDSSVLTIESPASVLGSQRLTLQAARWGDLPAGRVLPLPAYLWDARHAGGLRAAVGGSAERVPWFSADGEVLPGASPSAVLQQGNPAAVRWLGYGSRLAGDPEPGGSPEMRGDGIPGDRPSGDGRPGDGSSGYVTSGDGHSGDGVSGEGPPSRVERGRSSPTLAGAFDEAGFVIDGEVGADWPRYDEGATMRTVDPVRLHHDVRLLAARTGMPTWTLWVDSAWHLRFEVGADHVSAGWRSVSGGRSAPSRSLPVLHTDLARYSVDLDLVRAGRLTPGDLHPLVRAALFPAWKPAAPVLFHGLRDLSASPFGPDTAGHVSLPGSVSPFGPDTAGRGPAPGSVSPASGPGSAPASASVPGSVAPTVGPGFLASETDAAGAPVPGSDGPASGRDAAGLASRAGPAGSSRVSAAPGVGAVVGSVDVGAVVGRESEPVRVRCRGAWHEVGVWLGRLDLRSHTAVEQQRERAMRAFGGEVSGCFAVEQAWHGASGRLPRRLRVHREDLWQRMLHGGTRTVFELLDAGMDPRLRDSRGRTLMHRVRSFDHVRLLPRLIAEGLDVNAHDREGSTPLYLAVVHRWPADLIIALADAGADPHAPNQGDMSVIEHFDEILDYYEDLPADFEAAVAYLRKRA